MKFARELKALKGKIKVKSRALKNCGYSIFAPSNAPLSKLSSKLSEALSKVQIEQGTKQTEPRTK